MDTNDFVFESMGEKCKFSLKKFKYPIDKNESVLYNIQERQFRWSFLGRLTRREGKRMAEVRVKENESLDSALRRFKRQCQRSGIQAELRKRECYEKPSVKRKKKSEAARKRKYK